jgi:hypothetical protein
MLSAADKRWLLKQVKKLLDDMVTGYEQAGGYDGATNVPEDEDGSRIRRRVGFDPHRQDGDTVR